MFLDKIFHEKASQVFESSMGTENISLLLYAFVKSLRPDNILGVGLGYSSLYILKAMHDSMVESVEDKYLLANSEVSNDISGSEGRRSLLNPNYLHGFYKPLMHAVDDFSDGQDRLNSLFDIINELGFESLINLYPIRYQDFPCVEGVKYDLIWIDCGHQIEYSDLINKFWPMLSDEGGVLAFHYSHIDVDVSVGSEVNKVVFSGPVANEIKRLMLLSGISASYEVFSLVEPHKHRQGSVTIVRRLNESLACRETSIDVELLNLYGVSGKYLADMSKVHD